MTHIRKRPNRAANPWQVRYRDPAGVERSRHFPRKIDAERFAATVSADIVRGQYIDPHAGRQTFSEYVNSWLATKAAVSPRTRINIEGRIENYARPTFGPMTLASVRPSHARAFVADLVARGLAPATVKAITLTTAQVFAQAVHDGIIARSPFDGIELPADRHREEMHFLGADQVNVLASTIDDRYRSAIYVAAYGGLRAGELWALRVERVNVLARTIEVVESLAEVRGRLVTGPTKTGKRRTITIPSFLAEMLGAHIGRYSSGGYVFTAAQGGAVRHRNFMSRQFAGAVERAGLPDGLRFHDLRHTAAALLIANGRHMEEVKDYLGHSSIRVTSDRYAHLFPRARAEIADALDATFRASAPAPADHTRTTASVTPLQRPDDWRNGP